MARPHKISGKKPDDSESLHVSRQRPAKTKDIAQGSTAEDSTTMGSSSRSCSKDKPPKSESSQSERIVSLRKVSEKLAGRAIDPDIMVYLREFYALLDSNNSGEISRPLLSSFLLTIGINASTEYLDQLMGGRSSLSFCDLVQRINSMPYALTSRAELNAAANVLLESDGAGACQIDAAEFRELMSSQGISGPELDGLVSDFGKQTAGGLKIDLDKLASLISF